MNIILLLSLKFFRLLRRRAEIQLAPCARPHHIAETQPENTPWTTFTKEFTAPAGSQFISVHLRGFPDSRNLAPACTNDLSCSDNVNNCVGPTSPWGNYAGFSVAYFDNVTMVRVN